VSIVKDGQVAVVTDKRAGYVTVKIERHTACKKCGACDLGLQRDNNIFFELKNHVNAEIGDQVVISVAGRDILKASLLLYVVPLVGLVLGMILGGTLTPYISAVDENLLRFIVGICLMFIGLLIVGAYDKRIAPTDRYKPQIIRKLSRD